MRLKLRAKDIMVLEMSCRLVWEIKMVVPSLHAGFEDDAGVKCEC